MREEPLKIDYAAVPHPRPTSRLAVFAFAAGLTADVLFITVFILDRAGLITRQNEENAGLVVIASLASAIVGAVTGVLAWYRRITGKWEIAAVVVCAAYFINIVLFKGFGQ